MNWGDAILWGLCAAALLALIESAGLWLGLTRMSMPIILGSAFVLERDRAAFVGTILHLLAGVAFGLLYAAIFEELGHASWWAGMLLGIGQSLFMLGVIIPVLPTVHPHMASRREGPNPLNALQAPGFMAQNYGRRTLLVSLISHAAFGLLFGMLYHVHG